MKRAGGYRLDRGWTIAPGGLEPPYEGRLRDSLAGFTCPDAAVAQRDDTVALEAPGLKAVVTLSPFGIAWHRAGEDRPFLQDRHDPGLFPSPARRARSST